MLSHRSAAIVVSTLGTIFLSILFAAWRADRRDRAQLAADLSAANEALSQATLRQHARDAQLQQALAAIDLQKRTVTTPAQIIRELPKHIPLPEPITLQSQTLSWKFNKGLPLAHPWPNLPGVRLFPWDRETPATGTAGKSTDLAASENAGPRTTSPDQAQLPLPDLKPIYDFALDCRACQAKLTAAQGDLADERAKTVVLTRERDAALRTAKGGSVLRRAARAAKWFLIGAATGIVAAQAGH